MSDEPDDWDRYAIEVLGFPEAWRWNELVGIGSDRASGGCRMIGWVEVDGVRFTGNPVPGTEREAVVSFREHDAFVARMKAASPR